MQNTIMSGATVTLNDNTPIQRNSMVAISKKTGDIQILRVIGFPGDEIEINNGNLFINKKLLPKAPLGKKVYTIYLKNPSLFEKLKKYDFSTYSNNYTMFSLANDEYNDILKLHIADSIYEMRVDSNQIQAGIIKNSKCKYSNSYFLGPIQIPTLNTIIDNEMIALIPDLSEKDIGKRIGQEFFFCIGDNFPVAKDSRFIGLIAKKNIIGIVQHVENVKSLSVN